MVRPRYAISDFDALNCCVNVSGLCVEHSAPGLDGYPLPHIA